MNIIQTHSFKTLVTSRFIRILASTDVRWIGSAEKCFRFEIIGCDPEQIIPEINFEATSKPAGNYCDTYKFKTETLRVRVETKTRNWPIIFCLLT